MFTSKCDPVEIEPVWFGTGCVYPSDVPTIANQLSASGLTWRDYNESMGADPSREASECGRPGIKLDR